MEAQQVVVKNTFLDLKDRPPRLRRARTQPLVETQCYEPGKFSRWSLNFIEFLLLNFINFVYYDILIF